MKDLELHQDAPAVENRCIDLEGNDDISMVACSSQPLVWRSLASSEFTTILGDGVPNDEIGGECWWP